MIPLVDRVQYLTSKDQTISKSIIDAAEIYAKYIDDGTKPHPGLTELSVLAAYKELLKDPYVEQRLRDILNPEQSDKTESS